MPIFPLLQNGWKNNARRKKRSKELAAEKVTLEKIKATLEAGALVNTLSFEPGELPFVKELNLLTSKPILYVLNKKLGGKNLDELPPAGGDARYQRLMEYFKKTNAVFVALDAAIELELNELSQEEREEYKKELGIAQASGLDALITKSYELLGLETYITTGEMETRAWTIRKGTKAPQAAAEIHGDFEKKFIRAEVINWQDLLDAGSYAAAREKGLLRIEGKEYIVKDGDVVEFKI